jgi:hypothetical protein
MPVDVKLFDELEAAARDAGAVLTRERQPSPYDNVDWLRLTRDHVLGAVPLVAARARNATAEAWLFLAERDRGRAEPYGSWYTLRYAPVFGGGRRPDLVEAIGGELRRKMSALLLYPLDEDDSALLGEAFGRSGWICDKDETSVNWVADTEGLDFEAYWARRPSRLRNTAKRKAAKAKLRIEIFDRFEPSAWEAYEAVYRVSWKPEEGSPAFVRAFAEQAGGWGTLRLGVARKPDGTPVAAQLWTLDGDVATIHKLSYAEAEKANSPGTILSEAMFRHVIERDRPRLIDFGTGDDGYKADWMDRKRPLYRLGLYNRRSLTGLGLAARARLAALVARRRSR